MSSLAILYRRVKKLIFFLIIFYLVRSYYLRKKRGDSGGKRISGPPERKRITDGREQKSEDEKENVKKEDDTEKEKEKAIINFDNTETAVDTDIHDEFKKDENHVIEKMENDSSYYVTENIKDPKYNKDNNSLDIEKTEIVNEIIKENELEERTRQIPVINNIEIIPTSIIDDIQIQIPNKQPIKEIINVDEEEKKILENEISEPVVETINNNNKEILIPVSSPMNDAVETKIVDDITNPLNEKTNDNLMEQQEQEPKQEQKEQQPEELITKVEKVIEEPEKLIEIVEDIIIPEDKKQNEIIENPERVNVIIDDVTKSLEESESNVIVENISEEIIEPPLVEETLKEVVEAPLVEEELKEVVEAPLVEEELKEVVEKPLVEEELKEVVEAPLVEEELKEVVENNSSIAEKIVEDIIESVPEPEQESEIIEKVQNVDLSVKALSVKAEEFIEDIIKPETLPIDNNNEIEVKKEEIAIEENDKEQEIMEKPKEEEEIIVDNENNNNPEKSEVIEEIIEEVVEIPISDDSTEPQAIEDVTEEVIELSNVEDDEKPLIDFGDISHDLPITSTEKEEGQYIESLINEIDKVVNDSESDQSFIKDEKEKENVEVKKPVKINSADVIGHEEIIYEGGADGDDEGEWVDEDDDGEWVDEDEDEDEKENSSKKQENSKKQSLLINTSLNNKLSSHSLNGNSLNTPSKRQSLHLNTPMDLLMSSLKTPLSTSTTAFPLPIYNQDEKKPKVLPDVILDRIFRETDPQTMWVLRNTSLKTRAIVDNILRETFEQFDLSMDPLYFDVTSKENLGLVLNSLDLSPFALSMLLHEILKLDSQHIGYAFGQMFRVPSKIDIDYLTELIVDTLCILKEKKDVDIAAVMNGLQHYYCFNHSELEFYQLFEMIDMSAQEVARFIQNHHHFILSKSLPPLLSALDVDEVFVAEMCKTYANDDMDSFARIISKVPVHLVRTSIHPGDVQGDRVVMVNENGEKVIVVLNDNENKNNGNNGNNSNKNNKLSISSSK
jgi:hypothetical protein